MEGDVASQLLPADLRCGLIHGQLRFTKVKRQYLSCLVLAKESCVVSFLYSLCSCWKQTNLHIQLNPSTLHLCYNEMHTRQGGLLLLTPEGASNWFEYMTLSQLGEYNKPHLKQVGATLVSVWVPREYHVPFLCSVNVRMYMFYLQICFIVREFVGTSKILPLLKYIFIPKAPQIIPT